MFLPVISQVKKDISQVWVLLWGAGIHFFSPNSRSGVGFVGKTILRIQAGTARLLVTWFSQYSCLKVQNFAIIGQLWQAKFPDKSAWFIYHFEERNVSFLNHAHTWSHLLWYAHQSCKMLKFRQIFHAKE